MVYITASKENERLNKRPIFINSFAASSSVWKYKNKKIVEKLMPPAMPPPPTRGLDILIKGCLSSYLTGLTKVSIPPATNKAYTKPEQFCESFDLNKSLLPSNSHL